MVSCIAFLNSIANTERRGRDDLDVGILQRAQAVVSCNGSSPSKVLAEDVIASFESLRSYLRTAGQCLERVDAHLGNNVGLVARLVKWEEAWEIGASYVQDGSKLEALAELVNDLTVAQQTLPRLVETTNANDAELFLVLPRLVCRGPCR